MSVTGGEQINETVTIGRLGHRGDGIAETDTGLVYVPFTLPGERVEIDRTGERGRLLNIFETSPARTAPRCKHFGACGGCALQHMKQNAYLAWKREQLHIPLSQRGIDAPVEPVEPVPIGSRRRAVFTARRVGKHSVFGYHARQSHEIIKIEECPILSPEIARVLPGLAELAGPLTPLKGEVRIGVTATETGLDVAFEGPKPRPPALMALAAPLLEKLGIARLSIAGETVMSFAEPMVRVDGAEIDLPPLAFLQAASEAERIMGRLVLEGVAQAKEIAASKVAKVVAVSCNPATLARDLKTLVDGGYRIDRVTPVDQFLFSPHIEAVVQLSRDT